MRKTVFILLIGALLFCLAASEGFAQGPPINTDSPIVLGLSGRAVRTFGKLIRIPSLRQDGEKITDPDDSKVTVWVTPLAIPYNVTDRLQVAGIFPFVNASLRTRTQRLSNFGLSDIQFFAKYVWYQADGKNKTFRIASRVDLKLPTSDEKETPALGTGSTDFAFSTVAGWIENRVGVYLEGGYGLNTSNGGVNYGNSFLYNLALGYRVVPVVYETYPSPQLNAFLELNGNTTARSAVNALENPNSGGTTIYLSPGLQYIGGRLWLVEGSFQYPIVNNPNGTQLATAWTASLGVRLLLY